MTPHSSSFCISQQEEDDWYSRALAISNETGAITTSELESDVRGLRYVKHFPEVQCALTQLSYRPVTQNGAPVDRERVVKMIKTLCSFSTAAGK